MLWLLHFAHCLIRDRKCQYLHCWWKECIGWNILQGFSYNSGILYCHTQVYCHYFICFVFVWIWLVISTKAFGQPSPPESLACGQLSLLSGTINTFSEMVLLWIAQNTDRIIGVCINRNEKKYLKGPRQLDFRHRICEHILRSTLFLISVCIGRKIC